MAKDKVLACLPQSYIGRLFDTLDISNPIGLDARDRIIALTEELGGESVMTIVKRAHTRNYVALGILIEGELHNALHGRPYDAGVLTQLINTETGIGRILGLERRPRQLEGVQAHLEKKRRPADVRESVKGSSESNRSSEAA
jgi:hypothetical protein